LAVVQCGVTPEGALDEVIKLPARIVTACTFGGPHLDQLSALLRRRITAGGQAELMRRRPAQVPTPRSGFAGFRFPSEVIMVAVQWYLRYGLSYRDVEELLAERGIAVDHVTIYRWVQRFTPLLIEAARPCRHASGDRWFVDETYVKVAAPRSGTWRPRADSSPAHYSTARDPLRSRLTKHRPTPEWSMSCCPPPVTSPSSTPTTLSKPIMAG
jgi:hypothetical protein